jgi:ribonuclease Z
VLECDGELCHPAFENVTIKAVSAAHAIPCIAFSLSIRREGRFDAAKAKAKGVPMHLWNVIRREGVAEENGTVYHASDVMGEERKGIKISYITDTRPTDELIELAGGSDLLVCEGMFADPEKLPRAEKTKHMMFSEAAELARNSNSQRLVLTHFSPSLPEPEEWEGFVRELFPSTDIATDGLIYTINFDPR